MDKDTFIPTRDEVRLELQARLLSDALRLGTLYGPEKVAHLVGKTVPSLALVTPSLGGYPGQLTLEDFDLDKLQVGQLTMAMYEYAFEFRHPVGMLPDVFQAETEALEDFVFQFDSEIYWLFMNDTHHSRDAGAAGWKAVPALVEHTKARLALDLGESLTIKQLALLSRITERAVKNATSASGDQKLIVTSRTVGQHAYEFADNKEARRWLEKRREFVETKFQDVTERPGDHPKRIDSLFELGQYLNARWYGLKKTPESIVAELDWDVSKIEYVQNIMVEPHNIDPRDCEYLAKSLLVSASWFTEQVMRLLFPKQIALILEGGEVAGKSLSKEIKVSVVTLAEDAAEMGLDNVSTRLMCVLLDGTKLFPVKMKNRKTSRIAYRVSAGGKGGNSLGEGEEIDSEDQMIDLVVNHGYAVRMANAKTAAKSLYKLRARAVQAAYLDGQLLK